MTLFESRPLEWEDIEAMSRGCKTRPCDGLPCLICRRFIENTRYYQYPEHPESQRSLWKSGHPVLCSECGGAPCP